VGAAAERRKAFHNEGNIAESNLFCSTLDSVFISNLNSIGILVGDDDASSSELISKLREKALGRVKEGQAASVKENILEKEEKEMLEEEELERLFSENICSEIMDPRSDYDVVPPKGYNLKKTKKMGKKGNRFSK
jgi:hypothetical protein